MLARYLYRFLAQITVKKVVQLFSTLPVAELFVIHSDFLDPSLFPAHLFDVSLVGSAEGWVGPIYDQTDYNSFVDFWKQPFFIDYVY